MFAYKRSQVAGRTIHATVVIARQSSKHYYLLDERHVHGTAVRAQGGNPRPRRPRDYASSMTCVKSPSVRGGMDETMQFQGFVHMSQLFPCISVSNWLIEKKH